jgi:hypothetical protein
LVSLNYRFAPYYICPAQFLDLQQMEPAQEKGKTCIEYHKGIVHKLPDDMDD